MSYDSFTAMAHSQRRLRRKGRIVTPIINPLAAAPSPPSVEAPQGATDQELWRAAKAFEAVFIAEMMKHAGVGEARQAFGGGVGEEAFQSLLSREWAEDLSEVGGFGLAKEIYEAVKRNV